MESKINCGNSLLEKNVENKSNKLIYYFTELLTTFKNIFSAHRRDLVNQTNDIHTNPHIQDDDISQVEEFLDCSSDSQEFYVASNDINGSMREVDGQNFNSDVSRVELQESSGNSQNLRLSTIFEAKLNEPENQANDFLRVLNTDNKQVLPEFLFVDELLQSRNKIVNLEDIIAIEEISRSIIGDGCGEIIEKSKVQKLKDINQKHMFETERNKNISSTDEDYLSPDRNENNTEIKTKFISLKSRFSTVDWDSLERNYNLQDTKIYNENTMVINDNSPIKAENVKSIRGFGYVTEIITNIKEKIVPNTFSEHGESSQSSNMQTAEECTGTFKETHSYNSQFTDKTEDDAGKNCVELLMPETEEKFPNSERKREEQTSEILYKDSYNKEIVPEAKHINFDHDLCEINVNCGQDFQIENKNKEGIFSSLEKSELRNNKDISKISDKNVIVDSDTTEMKDMTEQKSHQDLAQYLVRFTKGELISFFKWKQIHNQAVKASENVTVDPKNCGSDNKVINKDTESFPRNLENSKVETVSTEKQETIHINQTHNITSQAFENITNYDSTHTNVRNSTTVKQESKKTVDKPSSINAFIPKQSGNHFPSSGVENNASEKESMSKINQMYEYSQKSHVTVSPSEKLTPQEKMDLQESWNSPPLEDKDKEEKKSASRIPVFHKIPTLKSSFSNVEVKNIYNGQNHKYSNENTLVGIVKKQIINPLKTELLSLNLKTCDTTENSEHPNEQLETTEEKDAFDVIEENCVTKPSSEEPVVNTTVEKSEGNSNAKESAININTENNVNSAKEKPVIHKFSKMRKGGGRKEKFQSKLPKKLTSGIVKEKESNFDVYYPYKLKVENISNLPAVIN